MNRFIRPFSVAIGVSSETMGLIVSIPRLSMNVFQIGWGVFSDKWGKKIFISIGYLISGLIIGMFLVFKTPSYYPLLVSLWSISLSMAFPGWSALLGDYSTIENRGATLGAIGVVLQLSGFFVLTLAFFITFIYQEVDPYSIPFIIGLSSSISCSILVLFCKEKTRETRTQKLDVSSAFKDQILRRFFLFCGVNSFAMAFA